MALPRLSFIKILVENPGLYIHSDRSLSFSSSILHFSFLLPPPPFVLFISLHCLLCGSSAQKRPNAGPEKEKRFIRL